MAKKEHAPKDVKQTESEAKKKAEQAQAEAKKKAERAKAEAKKKAEQAARLVQEVLGRFTEVVKDPEPQVGIQEFADSAINIGYRYWVPTVKFFHTSYAVNLAVYKALQTAGIKIPFPQHEVHLLSRPST